MQLTKAAFGTAFFTSEFQLGYPISLNCCLVHQSGAVKFHFNLTAGAETGLKLSAAIKGNWENRHTFIFLPSSTPPTTDKPVKRKVSLFLLILIIETIFAILIIKVFDVDFMTTLALQMYIILGCPELPLTFAYPTPEFPTPNFEYHTAFDGVVFGIENLDFKGFKKKGIEPRLNDLMWQMFGGIVAIGENAWAPSSGVLPSGVPMGDDTPNEGFGDSDENSNENESIPPNEVPSNPPRETLN
ncbi:hypothetical protein PVK06_017474 [Gossypium arboreum]|uniref:Uncharacterized protein n=1 Tax=Gossypium arboreum TaxID=29729 RepID=A0ABR0Q355_GOSAR|nr:hypothetical protein PVK06_017474 [Gossypium arboreum]